MDVSYQRRIASDILKCGSGRVWIDSAHLDDVKNAVTKSHIRALIKMGIIKKLPKKGISRGRAKLRDAQRKKGRQRGHGNRKGASNARTPKKKKWMATIRAIRKELKYLRENETITPSQYRKYYLRAKGGTYRSRANLLMNMKTDGITVESDMHGNQ